MKTIILLIATFLCLCSCTENYYFNEASRYYDAGEYEKAIEYYDKVLAKNPENYDAYINKGLAYSDLSKNEDAIKIYSQAITISPDVSYGYDYRAESYMRLNKYKEAVDDYTNELNLLVGDESSSNQFEKHEYNVFVTQAGDDLFSIYADRGVAYFFLDSLDLAWKDLNVCIDNSKELAMCYYWRGHIYFKLNQKELACKDLKVSGLLGYNEAIYDYRKYCDCDTIK